MAARDRAAARAARPPYWIQHRGETDAARCNAEPPDHEPNKPPDHEPNNRDGEAALSSLLQPASSGTRSLFTADVSRLLKRTVTLCSATAIPAPFTLIAGIE
jgi:hypothetical protein